MQLLHKTEFGQASRTTAGRQIVLHFNQVSLRLTPLSLKKLGRHLQQIDLNQGIFTPEERVYEIAFATYPITIYLNYHEIYDLIELVDEALAQFELYDLLENAKVDLPPADQAW